LWQARADLFPTGGGRLLLLPLFASAYGFCQVEAKTADGYFRGFPSYWNLVAFYVYLLRLPPWVNAVVVAGFAVLTFVPSRYLYPTQRGRLNLVTILLSVPWAGVLLWILARLLTLPADADDIDPFTRRLVLGSLAFPAYYLGVSWVISLRGWRTGAG